MHLPKSKSLWALVFCSLFLAICLFEWRNSDEGWPRVDINWDISGYYLYLPSLFYDDLGEMHNRQYIVNTYHPCGATDFYAGPCPTGKYIIKYSSGMAVMYFPGFIVGHFLAKHSHYPVDGFSFPYRASMALYTLLISLVGLWVIRKVLLVYFSDSVVAVALIALCLATNYLAFSVLCGMLSHNYLFTVYALIIYLTQMIYKNPDYKKAGLLGLLCGLAALTRPTEIICILIPLLWELDSFSTAKNRLFFFKQHYSKLVVFLLCAVAVGAIQLVYWKIYSGHFLYWSYGNDQGFDFLKVHIHDCLFSYKKGWFTYTPFMVLSLVGFIPLYFQNKKLFWPVILFTCLCLYFTFTWKCWWYGGSFSMRAVIQYYALLIFPVCACIAFCFKRVYTAVLFFLFLAFCIWLNVVMTYQAGVSYIMECDNMSKAYYWKIFGKLHIDRAEMRLIECEDELPDNLATQLKEIYHSDFNSDTAAAPYVYFKGEKVQSVGKERQYFQEVRLDIRGKGPGWYRATASVYADAFDYDFWTQPKVFIAVTDDQGKEIKRNYYRIQRIIDGFIWTEIPIDIKVPEHLKAYGVKFGMISYSGSQTMYVKDIKVYYTDKLK